MSVIILKHIACEGPGYIEDFLIDHDIEYRITNLYNNYKIPDIETCGALIALGGPMNVYQEKEYPFLIEENNIIQEAVKNRIPSLGICLGAQLLAKSLGAKITKNVHKEIGHLKISLTDEGKKDRLFKGFNRIIDVFQWHSDTFEIPKQAIKLATSELCNNQAFRYGENAYGLQFHLEVKSAMIRRWIDEYRDEVNSLKKEINFNSIIDESYYMDSIYKKHSERLMKNFLRISEML